MAELLTLRLVHVFGAIFWLGSGIFTSLFLVPTLAAAGPATAGPVMRGLQQRRLYTILPIVAILTILSGLRLMWIAAAGNADWFASSHGMTYSISGALSVVAFAVSVIVGRPAATRMSMLSQSATSDAVAREALAAEIRSLQKRLMRSTMFANGSLILAAAGMAVARYL